MIGDEVRKQEKVFKFLFGGLKLERLKKDVCYNIGLNSSLVD